jgi:hypothetical protein
MRQWRVLIGVATGLILAVIVLVQVGDRTHEPPSPTGPVLSDCDGALRQVVIQYVSSGRWIVMPVYRDFLRGLASDVTVHVVCPRREDFDQLVADLGPVSCRLQAVCVDHAMTCWSRDRWLCLAPVGPGAPTTLLSPAGEAGAEMWPTRAGDQRIGEDIARALAPGVEARRSPLYFDGGDFVADSRTVFASPVLLGKNVGKTVQTREELLSELQMALGRPVVLLNDAPDHHVGMYLMPVGDGLVLVGDPSMGHRLLTSGAEPTTRPVGEDLCPPDGPDSSPATQRLFDAVAEQCAAAGYRVLRVPTLIGRNARTYVTYLNVIIDHRAGQRLVYMPVYRGAEVLNEAAAGIWRTAGYAVRPVDCTSAYVHFGALHCLVNVLRRE